MNNNTTQNPSGQTPEPRSVLDWALHYAKLGYKVFPLVKGAKLPTGGSHGVKDATVDETQIRQWFQHGDYNIGLATEGTLTIDLDFVKGSTKSGDELQADLESAREFYDDGSYSVNRTRSNGRHIIYRMPPELKGLLKNAVKMKHMPNFGDVEVDIRTDGGYSNCLFSHGVNF